MNNDNFYSNLNENIYFSQISNNTLFSQVPNDWYLIATDIKNSTKLIEEGRYKDINLVGALTIISILNLNKSIKIPFVFGGDGAFLLVPKSLYTLCAQALLAIEKISKENYSFDLRVGIIPVIDILNAGKKLLISKYRVSDDYFQAIIKGGGLEYGDFLLKKSDKYSLKMKIDSTFNLDTEGLECRWNSIKSPKNKTLSIIVKCFDEKDYEKVFLKLEKILGKDRSPITIKNLSLSFNSKNLESEISLYTNKIIKKFLLKLKVKCTNLIGYFLMKFNIGKWSSYKKRILNTSDTEKFDDTLRMVVSANSPESTKLCAYLEEEYKTKSLVYGIHESKSSLMTCLIFQRHGQHVHFVDGANGGYASAAKAMKKRLSKINKNQ